MPRRVHGPQRAVPDDHDEPVAGDPVGREPVAGVEAHHLGPRARRQARSTGCVIGVGMGDHDGADAPGPHLG